MSVLLPYYIFSAALSAATCLAADWTGLTFVCFLVLLFAAYFIAALVLSIALIWAATLFVDMEKPQRTRKTFYCFLLNFAVGVITALSGVKLHVSGEEKLPEGRFLFVCNHLSAYDPIVTAWALRKHRLAFISKPENMQIPIVGRLIHKCCFMAIDRENDRKALKTILAAIDLIKRDEASVAVYPEGTRSTVGQLLPFRNGVFKIAQKARAPIAVAFIKGSENVKKNLLRRPTDVYLEIRHIIGAEEAAEANTNELGDKVRRCMLCESC